jgi:hypothetical protein
LATEEIDDPLKIGEVLYDDSMLERDENNYVAGVKQKL